MNLSAKLVSRWLVLILAVVLAHSAGAQVLNSGASTITLQAVLNDSITLSLSANAFNFTLTAGSASNPGSTSIAATTTWLLKPSVGSVKVYAFFSNSAAALSDGAGDNIPSADFQISNNAGPFTALTNPVPFNGANAGLQLSSTRILGNNRTGSHQDSDELQLQCRTPAEPASDYVHGDANHPGTGNLIF